jgi:hypothetical protein
MHIRWQRYELRVSTAEAEGEEGDAMMVAVVGFHAVAEQTISSLAITWPRSLAGDGLER